MAWCADTVPSCTSTRALSATRPIVMPEGGIVTYRPAWYMLKPEPSLVACEGTSPLR